MRKDSSVIHMGPSPKTREKDMEDMVLSRPNDYIL